MRIQWESFLLFCFYFNFVHLPASTQTIQLYAQFLSRTFKSVDSIRNYISGVKTFHAMLGFSTDHIDSYMVNLSLKGIARLNPHAVKRAEPMTIAILFHLYDYLDFAIEDNVRYWCLFLFAFFLVARKSNLVPTSKDDICAGKFLQFKDITVFEDYLLVKFRWSKTIQFGERQIECPVIKLLDKRICPYSAFQNLLKLKNRNSLGAVFVTSDDKLITYSKFQRKLRSCLNGIGLDSNLFSTHSFRRGFATLAFQYNVLPEHIQLLGDWKSDAYKCYLQLSWLDKLDILKSMFKDL